MIQHPLKLVLLLAGIFLAGAVSGGFLTGHYLRSQARERGMPERWGPERLKLLEKRLQLTEEQVAALKPIIRRDIDALNKLRQTSVAETRRILQRMEADTAALLSPEQKKKFEALNEEMRERFRKQFEQRRGDRGDKRDGRPPGPPPGDAPGEPPPPPPEQKQP